MVAARFRSSLRDPGVSKSLRGCKEKTGLHSRCHELMHHAVVIRVGAGSVVSRSGRGENLVHAGGARARCGEVLHTGGALGTTHGGVWEGLAGEGKRAALVVKGTGLYTPAVPDHADGLIRALAAKERCQMGEAGRRGAGSAPNALYTLPARITKRSPNAGRLRWLSM